MRKPKTNKLVLITGATAGIGYATTKVFAKKGYDLIICGRRKVRLESIKIKFQVKYGINIKILCFDVRNKKSVKKAISSLGKMQNQIDILVNNAGLAKGKDPIFAGETEHWEAMMNTNVMGLLYVTRLISPFMVERKEGHIINVCSSAGHEVYPNGNVYCASKHAVNALTASMRLDLFKHNVRVSQISPGHVEETEFARVRFDGDKNKAKIYEDFYPLTAKDVAKSIHYIATQPKHITIQDIVLMGTQQASNNFINRSGRS